MLKTVSSITNAIGALNYKGTWDANANSPALASSVGTKGDYYVVGTAGSTNLNGISNWGVGDWVAFNGSVWQRVEGGADLNGVNLSVSGTSTLSGLTASTALALNASKEVVSVANTGTGNNVLATAPTLVGDVTLSTGNLSIGTSGKGLTTGSSIPLGFGVNGSTTQVLIDTSANFLVGDTAVTAGAERLRIKSAGTSAATAAISIANSAGTELFFIRSDGAFRTGSAAVSPYNNTVAESANCFINTDGTLLRATSSLKYKRDVQDSTHGLADVLKLRAVTYKGKNEVDGEKVYGGLIAEEVHEAGLTQFVQYAQDGTPDALNYGNMVSLFVNAIKELTARIEELEKN